MDPLTIMGLTGGIMQGAGALGGLFQEQPEAPKMSPWEMDMLMGQKGMQDLQNIYYGNLLPQQLPAAQYQLSLQTGQKLPEQSWKKVPEQLTKQAQRVMSLPELGRIDQNKWASWQDMEDWMATKAGVDKSVIQQALKENPTTAGLLSDDRTGGKVKLYADDVRSILQTAQSAATAAQGGGGQMSTLPVQSFAQGGIVNKPTVGILGQQGPEAVVPIQQATGPIASNRLLGMMGLPQNVGGQSMSPAQTASRTYGAQPAAGSYSFTPQPGHYSAYGGMQGPTGPRQSPGGSGAPRSLIAGPPQQQPPQVTPSVMQPPQPAQWGQGSLGGIPGWEQMLTGQGGLMGLGAQAQMAGLLGQIGLQPWQTGYQQGKYGMESSLLPYEQLMRQQQMLQQAGQAGMGMALQPLQQQMLASQYGLGAGQAGMEQALLPYEQMLRQAQMGTEAGLVPMRGQYEAGQIGMGQRLLPYQEALQQAQMGGEAAMLPQRYGLESAQIGAQQQLLPWQTQLGQSQAQTGLLGQGLERQLMPGRYGLEAAQIGSQMGLMPGRQQLIGGLLSGQGGPGAYGALGGDYGQSRAVERGLGQAAEYLQSRGLLPSGGLATETLGRVAGDIGAQFEQQRRGELANLMQVGLGARPY